MIRRVVDFALNNRLLVLGFALLLFAGGIVAFHDLPIEAYPDVADNYVEIITQWPGISAEQIEQQVTIPLEVVMNGIPHVVHLRSFSLFGLSDLKLIFDEESDNDWNRERVLERLSQVTLPPGIVPQMGTDWSPVGQIYFFTLHSTNPAYDCLAQSELPLLPHVVGRDGLRPDDKKQPLPRRDRVANLLMEGEAPRGHVLTVEPDVEPRHFEIAVQTSDKRSGRIERLDVIAPAVAEEEADLFRCRCTRRRIAHERRSRLSGLS